MTSRRILVVDDKDNMRSLFQRILPDYEVVTAENGAKALTILDSEEIFDVVVSDIKMPGLDGMTLLKELKRVQPEVEVILMTAYGTVESAVEAMKAGAFDYLIKPFKPDEAVIVVERALEVCRLRQQTKRLQEALNLAYGFGPFVGEGEPMRRVYSLLDKAASSHVSVLLIGESGTGKELAARTIHERSRRKDKPFVPINCGAMPEALAESELFGHVKGAFTGAHVDKPGLFEEARGGTLFLDEVNSFPLSLQVKLNRALEEREARRVGANKSYRLDVRVIAATNTDLKPEVDAQKFRDDLYFRLHVLAITLPALREHPEDIPLLVGHFLNEFARSDQAKDLSSDALKALLSYPWPGNVRELRNAIESALTVAEGDQITLPDLPVHIAQTTIESVPEDHLIQLTYQEAADLGRDRMVRRYLIALMKVFEGNVKASAEKAGIDRETLHRFLRKHGVIPAAFRR